MSGLASVPLPPPDEEYGSYPDEPIEARESVDPLVLDEDRRAWG